LICRREKSIKRASEKELPAVEKLLATWELI
jgi:hypothetical protein